MESDRGDRKGVDMTSESGYRIPLDCLAVIHILTAPGPPGSSPPHLILTAPLARLRVPRLESAVLAVADNLCQTENRWFPSRLDKIKSIPAAAATCTRASTTDEVLKDGS